MDGKMPMTILTDGDKSMHKVIENEWNNVTHRTCSWQILYKSSKLCTQSWL
ncbi:hypothetical protein Sjap_022170 [Stephania japonica]|uniref:Uncharacterized protein n=1 Tax=Stephania japonica TaxID=461633 RepID=A0AAP0HPM0_9MAGN